MTHRKRTGRTLCPRTVCIYRDSDSSGAKSWKKTKFRQNGTSNELFAQSFFTAVMSRNMHTSTFWFTRLDNTAVKDKLEAICSILNQFSEACNENYSPGCNLTVDERSATSRGRSSYTLYIKKAIQGSMVWKYECVQILRQHVLKL